MKKPNNLSALGKKIAHKSSKSSVYQKFEHADEALGFEDAKQEQFKRAITRSYGLTQKDIDNIKLIKDKCLNKKIVLSDSQIVRIAIMLASKLNEDSIIESSKEVIRLEVGRPKIR